MTFVVTDICIKCKYMDCVEVCPVDCFHEGENMLVIDSEECIDCTLCVPECPIDAIFDEEDLPEELVKFTAINAEYAPQWPVIDHKGTPPPDASGKRRRAHSRIRPLARTEPLHLGTGRFDRRLGCCVPDFSGRLYADPFQAKTRWTGRLEDVTEDYAMTTKTPIEELMHEHKHILKVVSALKVLGEQIERDEPVDIELLHGAGRFLREFADVCHHGKEEAVLFPAMERSGVPESGCPLGALRSEHKKGRKLVSSFRDSVEAYAGNRGEAREKLVADIAAICQFYPDHIWKEDDMVFPMVDRLFEPRDLEQLREDFDKAEEELGENHDWFVAFADQIAEATTNLVR